jgi:hypothetical protein|tara:strand:- start:222 stop:392 length:171 start_codon:yes stop_codon:yes gene_type:complete
MKTKDHNSPTVSKKKDKPKLKSKYSNAGKGDKSRVSDTNKYADNWEKIFGKGKKKK